GVFMTLALCYLLLYRQVLKPIGGIRGAMVRQQSGQRDARAEPQSSLEIDDVASTLNRMLDTLEDREEELSSRVVELEDAHKRLEAQADDLVELSNDLSHTKQQLNDAVENISEGFALWDNDDRLVMCNSRYKNLYPDLSDVIVPGTSFADFVRAAYEQGIFSLDGDDLEEAVQERVVRHQTSVSAFEQEMGDGRWVRVSKRTTETGHTVAILSDISDRIESEATIRRMAMEDPLTGLPNRAQFKEQLQSALVQADRTDRKVGVMLLDLDHFKNVNDTLGHAVGDELLVQVAARISGCLRDTDTVARLGGDEFAVIITNARQPDNIHLAGEKIIDTLSNLFLLDGKEVYTGASIGITIYPEDKGDQDQLLRNADLALYRAKEDGRGTCRLFDEKLHIEMQARSAMERDLRRAIAQNEFHMVYQPQIDLRSGELVGAESLIRWQHPERGLVSPAEFIPIAESTQQIIEISQWVFHNVCHQFASWVDAGMELPAVSINISPLHFRQEGLVDDIGAALSESGLDPQRLEIEITEGMAMAVEVDALVTLNKLKDMGLKLAIDDFGTGYSSLNRLKEFPVDRLKIDQSFIQNVTESGSDAAITSAIIQLGHTLNLRVIAEAAETREQIDFLTEQGCDEVQGYYFSRPLSAEDFVAFVESYEPKSAAEPENVEGLQSEPSMVRKQA
ncbi:MAG: EAL domain-containing protein, partial [Alphaproteobacteria bacterium]|nr:EAL domain-containing protein [Alphaproteobacteria bacterium]